MEYTEFTGTIKNLQDAEESLVGLEIVIQDEGTEGLPRKRVLITSTLLVGHVNADSGGCCGCCAAWRDDTSVLRYRRVYDFRTTPPNILEYVE